MADPEDENTFFSPDARRRRRWRATAKLLEATLQKLVAEPEARTLYFKQDRGLGDAGDGPNLRTLGVKGLLRHVGFHISDMGYDIHPTQRNTHLAAIRAALEKLREVLRYDAGSAYAGYGSSNSVRRVPANGRSGVCPSRRSTR